MLATTTITVHGSGSRQQSQYKYHIAVTCTSYMYHLRANVDSHYHSYLQGSIQHLQEPETHKKQLDQQQRERN